MDELEAFAYTVSLGRAHSQSVLNVVTQLHGPGRHGVRVYERVSKLPPL